MTQVAVTGATGYVGRHLVPLLRRDGYLVRDMEPSSSAWERATGSQGVDVDDSPHAVAVRRLVEGCNIVIHLAAHGADRVDGIVNGTRAIADEAGRAGVERFVFVSFLGAESASSFQLLRDAWHAEMIVRQTAGDMAFTIVRPSLIVGRTSPLLHALVALARRFPVIPVPGKGHHRCQPIDVEDFARCLMASATMEALACETVSVGGDMYVTYRQLADLVLGRLGVVRPKLLLPSVWFPHLASIVPKASSPLFSAEHLCHFHHGTVVSPGVVQSVFGFRPKPLPDVLTE